MKMDIGAFVIDDSSKELVKATTRKIKRILDRDFPDHLSFDEDRYTIARGSTQVMVTIRPFTKHDTVVECISHVVKGADIGIELMKFLMRKNSELHFGAFGLLFDGTIIFSHSITGANLDDEEFITSLNAVALIADHYDDEIVAIAGGTRALDNLESDLEE